MLLSSLTLHLSLHLHTMLSNGQNCTSMWQCPAHALHCTFAMGRIALTFWICPAERVVLYSTTAVLGASGLAVGIAGGVLSKRYCKPGQTSSEQDKRSLSVTFWQDGLAKGWSTFCALGLAPGLMSTTASFIIGISATVKRAAKYECSLLVTLSAAAAEILLTHGLIIGVGLRIIAQDQVDAAIGMLITSATSVASIISLSVMEAVVDISGSIALGSCVSAAVQSAWVAVVLSALRWQNQLILSWGFSSLLPLQAASDLFTAIAAVVKPKNEPTVSLASHEVGTCTLKNVICLEWLPQTLSRFARHCHPADGQECNLSGNVTLMRRRYKTLWPSIVSRLRN